MSFNRKPARKGRTVFAVFLLFFFMGCSNVNQENYEKISMGMDYKAVTDILGKPGKCSDILAANSCIWGDDAKNIKIKFVGGKVVFYSSNGLKP